MDNNLSVNETNIFSVFWTGEESIIYIESYDETMVRRVVDGMNLFLTTARNAFHLIPIEDRTLLLDQVERKNVPIPRDSFVRIKKGLYKGDLAQVVVLMEREQEATVRLVPRLDLQKGEQSYSASKVRPPQKFFDKSKVDPNQVKRESHKMLGRYYD